MKKRLLAGAALGALFLWLALRNVEPAEIWAVLRRTSYLHFALYLLMHLVTLWVRAVRWRVLALPLKDIPSRRLLPPLCIGFMVNFLLPARAGEIVRAYLLGRKEGIGMGATFATVVVERLFDGLAIFSFLLPAAFLLPSGASASVGRLRWAAPAVFAVYLAVLGSLFFLSHHHALLTRLLARIHAERGHGLAAKLGALVQRFAEGLAVLKSARGALIAVALSLGIWTLSAVSNTVMMDAIGLRLPAYAPFFLLVLQGFGVLVPSPGFVGPYQYAHVVALAVYGVGESVALSLALLNHAGLFVVILGTGFFFAAREHLGWREIEKASHE